MRLVGAHINELEISALDSIAQAHRVSRADVIRWAIMQYLRLQDKPAGESSTDTPGQPDTTLTTPSPGFNNMS